MLTVAFSTPTDEENWIFVDSKNGFGMLRSVRDASGWGCEGSFEYSRPAKLILNEQYTSSPYDWTWSFFSGFPGFHEVKAEVIDHQSNTASDSVKVIKIF